MWLCALSSISLASPRSLQTLALVGFNQFWLLLCVWSNCVTKSEPVNNSSFRKLWILLSSLMLLIYSPLAVKPISSEIYLPTYLPTFLPTYVLPSTCQPALTSVYPDLCALDILGFSQFLDLPYSLPSQLCLTCCSFCLKSFSACSSWFLHTCQASVKCLCHGDDVLGRVMHVGLAYSIVSVLARVMLTNLTSRF